MVVNLTKTLHPTLFQFLLLILWINPANSVGEYGSYQFWNNYGGIFYDYGGNNFHAINGNTIDIDNFESRLTDRGICCEENNFISLHNEIYNIPEFISDFSIEIWFFKKDLGVILTRECYLHLFIGTELNLSFYLWTWNPDTGWNYNWKTETISNLQETEWNHLFLSVNRNSEGNFKFFYLFNGILSTEKQFEYSELVEQEQVTHTAFLGKENEVCTEINESVEGNCIIYSLQISEITYEYGVYSLQDYTETCSGCYFEETPTCECERCPSNGSCIVELEDCTKPSDWIMYGNNLTNCKPGMERSHEICFTCENESWPICEVEETGLSFQVCHEACSSCFGININECYSCIGSNSIQTSFECSCPTGTYFQEDDCKCNNPGQTYTEGSCEGCTTSRVDPSSADCSCPENAVFSADETFCECPEGFFDTCPECSSDPVECSPCIENCETCTSGTYVGCEECFEGYRFSSFYRDCSENYCEDGEYNSWLIYCDSCHSECLTCYDGEKNNCLTCVDGAELQQDDRCLAQNCLLGKFADGPVCSDCHESCLMCNGPDSTDCTSCIGGKEFNDEGECECLSNNYYEGYCVSCEEGCASCDSSGCLECLEDYNWNSLSEVCEEIVCASNEYVENKICTECYSTCETCTGGLQTDCLTCYLGFYLTTEGECACNSGTYEEDGWCLLCDNSCLKCTGGTNQDCEICNEGYQTGEHGECLCEDGTYLNDSSCEECSPSCLTCTGAQSTDCDLCSENMYKNEETGECLCYQGLFFGVSSCIDCNEQCETCDDEAEVSCETCGERFEYNQLNKICECEEGYYNRDDKCVKCSDGCASCISTSSTDCTGCLEEYNFVESLLIGLGECHSMVCEEGFYLEENSCVECFAYCLNCTGSSKFDCSECIEGYEYENGECFYKETVCETGYFPEGNLCVKCDEICLTCDGSSSFDCLTCVEGYAITENNSCVETLIECEEGYYNEENICEKCHSTCFTCTAGSFLDCTSCKGGMYLEETGECLKKCLEGEYLENNICKSCNSICQTCVGGSAEDCTSCEEGKYLKEGECLNCQEDCKTCEEYPKCLSCLNEAYSPNSGGGCSLKCESNEYIKEDECFRCRDMCLSCDSDQTCFECIENAEWEGFECVCKTQYYLQNETCVFVSNFTSSIEILINNTVILEFEKELENNLEEADIILEADNYIEFVWEFGYEDKKEVRIELEFQSVVPPESTLIVTFEKEIEGYDSSFLITESLTGFLTELEPEEIEEIKKDTSASSTSIISSAFMFGAFAGFPPAVWSLINTVQIFAYIALSSNPLTPDLRAFLQALANYNPISNLPKQFLSVSDTPPFVEAYLFGFESHNFLINIGREFTILSVLLFLGGILFFLHKNEKIKKIGIIKSLIQKFTYSIYLRYWLEFYIKIAYCSLLQLQIVLFNQIPQSIQEYLEYFVALIFFVFSIEIASLISPFLFFHVLNINSSDIKEKIGTMTYEFRESSEFMQMQYYPLFLFRRLLMVFSLVFFVGSPVTQTIINIVLSCIVSFIEILLFLIIYSPFGAKLFEFSNSLTEIGTVFVMFLTVVYLFDVESDTKETVSYVIIGVILGVLLGNLIVSLSKSVETLIEKIRKKKKVEKDKEYAEVEITEIYGPGTEIYTIPKPFRPVIKEKGEKKGQSQDVSLFFKRS